jgi:hypothetical protein
MNAPRKLRELLATDELLVSPGVYDGYSIRLVEAAGYKTVCTSGAAVSNALLDHYRESLKQMRDAGFVNYGVRQLTPYTHAAIGAFSPKRSTLTDRLLDKL